jgi:uncharacterized protein YcfJ
MELNGRTRYRRLVGLAALLGAALLLGAAAAAKKPCCFANPQYAGVCAVEPAEGETCKSILDYLNNPQSQGKSYCGNTNVRGGWKQVACEKKSGTASR